MDRAQRRPRPRLVLVDRDGPRERRFRLYEYTIRAPRIGNQMPHILKEEQLSLVLQRIHVARLHGQRAVGEREPTVHDGREPRRVSPDRLGAREREPRAHRERLVAARVDLLGPREQRIRLRERSLRGTIRIRNQQ